jgi:hypothetical protein
MIRLYFRYIGFVDSLVDKAHKKLVTIFPKKKKKKKVCKNQSSRIPVSVAIFQYNESLKKKEEENISSHFEETYYNNVDAQTGTYFENQPTQISGVTMHSNIISTPIKNPINIEEYFKEKYVNKSDNEIASNILNNLEENIT